VPVAVSGASGFIGTAVVRDLEAAGHDVLRLVRNRAALGARTAHWDPASGAIDADALQGLDAVVNLCGESIAARWTSSRKARIRDSRVQSTRLLAVTLARLARPPRVLVCASAAGIYGDRGDEVLDEGSAPGSGFLAEVARQWEAAADPARERGIRVVHLRIALVLDPSGGALARLLPLFRFGLGAPLGSGRQWWSWITRDDLVGVVRRAIEADWAGPVNASSPQPVTCSEFTRVLARVLGRPTLPAVPGALLRLLAGEMADAALLASARLAPARLLAAGHRFRHVALEPYLQEILGPVFRQRGVS
jgi:uncharacterized protein (TIGR01777 family)